MEHQDWNSIVLNKTLKSDKTKEKVYDIDNEDDISKPITISLSNSKLIQQARVQKKMNQKDLANKINKDTKTIQLYESGKVIPDLQVMLKLEKVLGIKLNKKKRQ